VGIQEDESAEGLVLGRCGHVALTGEPVEEGADLGRAQFAQVAHAVEAHEPLHPIDVRALGADGVVTHAHRLAELGE
jgi:hypothetical protein